ncbi:MAG: CRISPR-associated endonuclease Cas1 [Candidatus Odinarchaeota archaeon]|nr:CRISPR-associated endonuclease Cas1 [Candidatus Odinarchaeota archaeon]
MRYIEKFGWGYILTAKDETMVFKTKDKNIQFKIEGETILTITGTGYIATKIFEDSESIRNRLQLIFKTKGSSKGAYIFNSDVMKLRLKQAQYYKDKKKRFALAKKFVLSGIINKIGLLRHFSVVLNQDALFNEDIENLYNEKKKLESLDNANINEIMGIEGTAARHYFQAITKIIPAEFNFEGRTKRPPTDQLNAALSYGYVITANKISEFLKQAGFNTKIGYLHEFGRGRDSLALDLLEEFRQPIVDMAAIPLVIKHILNPKTCFTISGGRALLNKLGKRHFTKALDISLLRRKKDILYQVGLLAQALLNDSEYTPYCMQQKECDYDK